MKKLSTFKLFAALCLIFGTAASANAQINYALRENFETGAIPAGWTQQNVAGSALWTVEQNGTYPAGAANGSFRAAICNTTRQTQKFVTRLITPAMRLDTVYRPILIFNYAQEHYLGDVDELRVYYRTSAAGNWVKIADYTRRERAWRQDTIQLIGTAGSYYQIAFEATDKFGRGVVLDNIRVRPLPVCTQPTITSIVQTSSDMLTLFWNASFDADSSRVIVSRTALDSPDDAENPALDTIVTDFQCLIRSLAVNTNYYFYVKTYCQGEESPYSAAYLYRTKATAAVPYYQSFNLAYNANVLSRLADWTYGNNWSEEQYSYCPFINTNTAESSRNYYSSSNTTCLVFASGNNISGRIKAGKWTYAVSPEILVNNINTVQVSFWGTAYTYIGADLQSSIIVGVMDNPEDRSTFVAVDTAVITKSKEFKEFIISLDGYTGTGKYIAFMSAFDKDNIFYIDDVTIETIPPCQKVTEVHTTQVKPTTAVITWDAPVTAQKYEIYVSKISTLKPDTLLAADIVYHNTNVPTNQVTATGLSDWSKYYVYVRALCGGNEKGAWSNEYSFRTPCEAVLPLSYSFEPSEGHFSIEGYTAGTHVLPACLQQSTGHTVPIYCYNSASYARSGTYTLWFIGYPESRAYLTFPTINDTVNMQDLRMVFWAKTSSASYETSGQNAIEVGVMTAPNNYDTFVPVDTINAPYATHLRCIIDFAKYNGAGKTVAIRTSTTNKGFCYVNVDDLVLEKKPHCVDPSTVNVVATETTATLTWDNYGAEYQVKISPVSIAANLAAETQSIFDTIVDTNSFLATNLLPNRTRYFYYIRTICGQDTSAWTYEQSFITECGRWTLPFTEDFESYTASTTSNVETDMPNCWDFGYYWSSTTHYPYITTSTTYFPNNPKCLYFYAGSSAYKEHFILPEMQDVTRAVSISELQLSFLLRQSAVTYVLEVGVTRGGDISTFEVLDSIRANASQTGITREINIDFSHYTGTGNRIAFRVYYGTAANYAYIDNIIVELAGCTKPKNLRARNITATGAELLWDKGADEQQWDLIVFKSATDLNPDTATQNIIFHDVVNTQSKMLTDLQSNTPYVFYLRSVCGTDTTAWTLNAGKFRTPCVPRTVDELGVEDFESYATGTAGFVGCWETGVLIGTSAAPYVIANGTPSSKRLYIFNTTSSDGTYAVMPALDIDSITRLKVTFNLGTTSTTATNVNGLIVGVITNTADIASFVPIDTIYVSVNDYKDYAVSFDSYRGDYNGDYGKRIMFFSQFGVEGITNYVYLDNVSLDTIASCAEPTKISFANITDKTADIRWNGNAALNYRVVVSHQSLNAATLAAPDLAASNAVDTVATVTGTTFTVTGLTMLKKYYVYVQKICSPAEASAWSLERTFMTACPAAIPLPYSENFEGYGSGTTVSIPCWNKYMGTATTPYTTQYPYMNTGTYNHTDGGNIGLYWYIGTTAGQYSMLVSPALDVDNISNTLVSFWLKPTSSTYNRSKLIVGVTQYPDSLTLDSFTPVDTISPYFDNPSAPNDWAKYTLNLSSLANDSNVLKYKHVVFAMYSGINEGSTGTVPSAGYLAFDDVEIEEIPTCFKPENVYSDNITTNSAHFWWSNETGNTKWNVQYGISGFTLGTGTTVSVDTASFVLQGLTQNTAYDFYVQAECGNGDLSNWTAVSSFMTRCLVEVADAHWGFEESEGWVRSPLATSDSYKIQPCFVSVNTSSAATYSYYPYQYANSTSAQYSKTGNYSLRLSAYSSYPISYLALPEINGDLDTLQIRFSARALYTYPADYSTVASRNKVSTNYSNTQNPYVIIGTLRDAGNFDTFEEIQKVYLSHWETSDFATPENNWLFDDIIVPLAGTQGKYITLAVKSINSVSYYVYLDDVVLEKETVCAQADNILFENFSEDVSSADLKWRAVGSRSNQWKVTVKNALTNAAVYDGIADTTVIQGIAVTPQTDYTVSIKSICAANDSSAWKTVTLRTPCSSTPVGFVWNFENNVANGTVYQISTTANYNAPECWVVGTKSSSTSYTYVPYIKMEGATNSVGGTSVTYSYGRADGGSNAAALYFYTSPSYNGGYAIMPAVSGSFDTLQLHFHARSVNYCSKTLTAGQGYKVGSTYATDTYARSIIVGTVTDPNDISTFVPLDTLTAGIHTANEYANAANNWLYDEFMVPLANATGNYVAFLSEFDKSNYIYLEDITIEQLGGCLAPRNLKVSEITSNSAKINFDLNSKGGEKWVVQVVRSSNLNSVVFKDTVNLYSAFVITGLAANTEYAAVVQQLCAGSTVSDLSAPVVFTTACKVPFDYDFSTFRHAPIGWARYGKTFTENAINTADLTVTAESTTTSTAAWIYTDKAWGLPASHQRVTVYGSTTTNEWLVTPLVELPAGDASWLTFDLALTDFESSIAPTIAEAGQDDKFMVIVSDDGGVTWKKSNATVWANDNIGNYVFEQIPNTGKKYFVDLTAYSGKGVKIAFYAESTVGSTTAGNRKVDLHLDNVHINRYASAENIFTICAYQDFTENGFDYTYNTLHEGENTLTRYIPSNTAPVADSIITAVVTVLPARQRIINTSTCEGEPYSLYDFALSAQAGTYKRKLSVAGGCDSVTVLNLTVTPIIRKTVMDTICHGIFYTFNGKTYNRSGLYIDTLSSQITGCDSIVSLYLKVNDAFRSELNRVICFGETFAFGGKTLNTSGTYFDTLQTARGCDSIVTLHLTARPELITIIEASTPAGVNYTGNGFIDVWPIAGDYTRDMKTAEGCDSIVILRLSIITALENVTAYELTIIPTIITQGGSVQISGDEADGEMRIEVYNALGQCIYNQNSAQKPTEIRCFNTAGVYLVRAANAAGKVRYGRVIVK